MHIYEVTQLSIELLDSFSKLLPQLSPTVKIPTNDYIKTLFDNENTHLLVAEAEGEIIGMLTLAVVDIPTGRKAWIEDVVVDGNSRGIGVGIALVDRAKELSASLSAKRIYLTSNPSRKAAHRLYKKCGFEQYDTTLFKIDISSKL